MEAKFCVFPACAQGHLATEEDTDQLASMLSEDDVPLSPALSIDASSDAETEDSENSDTYVRSPTRSVRFQPYPRASVLRST